MSNKILCTPRSAIPPPWLTLAGGLPADASILSALRSLSWEWMDRPQAEKDPRYKQWIPYLILTRNHQFAIYSRINLDNEQTCLLSCGFGGHVEKKDRSSDFYQTLVNAVTREAREECHFDLQQPNFIGLINEEYSFLGKTHIGVVFHHQLAKGQRLYPSIEVPVHSWHNYKQAQSMPMELWSHLALKLYRAYKRSRRQNKTPRTPHLPTNPTTD